VLIAGIFGPLRVPDDLVVFRILNDLIEIMNAQRC